MAEEKECVQRKKECDGGKDLLDLLWSFLSGSSEVAMFTEAISSRGSRGGMPN